MSTGYRESYNHDIRPERMAQGMEEISTTRQLTPLPESISVVSTPLRLPAWAEALREYPDEEVALFFLSGIAHGFRIGFMPKSTLLKSARQNLEGALSHPEVVEDYIKEEVRLGRVVGPIRPSLRSSCHISRFGVIPKGHQTNEWCLIVDLSFPKGHSINDGIPKHLCSLKYISIDDAVQEILSHGRGAILAKIDIKSAFRLIPVHPLDRHLLGMSWNNALYIDTCLPFGLRSAPKLFNLLADLLSWVLEQKDVKTLHYLDDFLLVGPPASNQCSKYLEEVKSTCTRLGIPLAIEKAEGPSTTLTFLGITLDTVQMEACLPPEKLNKIRETVALWLPKKKATKRAVLSLVGTLQHATKIVRPGRTFLRRMYATASKVRELHYYTRLGKEFRSDLNWWDVFLYSWNGLSFMRYMNVATEHNYTIQTDASGSWGCGAFFQGRWFQWEWPVQWAPMNILAKEPAPKVISCSVWGPQLAKHSVLFECDNSSVVAALSNGTAKDNAVMHLLRVLWFFVAYYNIELIPKHIPGVSNCTADHLSRNNLQYFNPQASAVSTPIPPSLLTLVTIPGPDWTSSSFKQLFNITIKEVLLPLPTSCTSADSNGI